MEIKKRTLEEEKDREENLEEIEKVKMASYECMRTKVPNIFKILGRNGGYLVRCYYGKAEKIDKKSGVKKQVNDITLRVVQTMAEAKQLLNTAENVRRERKEGGSVQVKKDSRKISLDDAIEDFKTDRAYTELSENYKMHYDNYCRHISDFMGYKEPGKIKVTDIEDYYNYQLKRGKLATAKRNKDGSISGREISKSNPEGISVNTLAKHKTALKTLWRFMIKKGGYGVESNVPAVSEIPKIEIKIDGKTIKTRRVQPVQGQLTLEELNYTLNDALQNEHDRSVAVMIALGAIGGLRRSEAVALKIGRYYHDDRMQTGEEMWQLNDFKGIRKYYEEHGELMLIDEAITHQRTDVLGFPKDNIIRMAGKPKCLEEIVEYAMEQRMQVCGAMGISIESSDRLYMPLINVIQQKDYSSQKLSRKWKEYQERRNKRMEAAGLVPIPVIRYHDLRHTHASLLSDELPVKKISRNMGHVIHGEGQVNNTTTKVYIHDREPDRWDIINYWDSHIKIDWDKALRVDINAPGNKAHVNGSGHLVIKDEDKKRAVELHKRFVLTEEEEVELLCSAE